MSVCNGLSLRILHQTSTTSSSHEADFFCHTDPGLLASILSESTHTNSLLGKKVVNSELKINVCLKMDMGSTENVAAIDSNYQFHQSL